MHEFRSAVLPASWISFLSQQSITISKTLSFIQDEVETTITFLSLNQCQPFSMKHDNNYDTY